MHIFIDDSLFHRTCHGHELVCCRVPSIYTVITQARTHTFNGPFSSTTQASWYEKGKTSLDFTEARDNEWQCKSAPLSRQITSPAHFLQAACPSERKCVDTIATVPVPQAGHLQCWNINVFFKWNIRKQFYQTAFGNCYGLKLLKCRLRFIVSFVIIFSTLSFLLLLSNQQRQSTEGTRHWRHLHGDPCIEIHLLCFCICRILQRRWLM